MEYVLHILTLIGIYTVLAVSLNLVLGYTGIMSIAHGAFYGVGAYTAAMLATQARIPFPVALGSAGLAAAVFGVLVCVPLVRLRGEHVVIATFAFQVIISGLATNCPSITGGSLGITGIPRPSLLGWELSGSLSFCFLSVSVAVVSVLFISALAASPFGRVLRAIREDDVLVVTMGKNVVAYRTLAFVIGSAAAGVAGCLYAQYMSFIDPTSFTIMESVLILTIVVVGGAGSRMGPVIGASVMILLPELLRFVGMPNSIAANVRQIIYGSLLVIMMVWRPRGLAGQYSFGKGQSQA